MGRVEVGESTLRWAVALRRAEGDKRGEGSKGVNRRVCIGSSEPFLRRAEADRRGEGRRG